MAGTGANPSLLRHVNRYRCTRRDRIVDHLVRVRRFSDHLLDSPGRVTLLSRPNVIRPGQFTAHPDSQGMRSVILIHDNDLTVITPVRIQ